jgi:FkbM family methyltransferase
VRATGLQVDWFPNSRDGGWHGADSDALLADGIRLLETASEDVLAQRLPDYEVALMPSGPAGRAGENAGVASLSLPTRVPFILGASDLPVIVLGDAASAVARFVTHHGVGASCAYDAAALGAALATVRDDAWRERQRDCLARVRDILRMDDVSAWVREATDSGRPPSLQFERLDVLPRLVIPQHIDETPSLGPWMQAFDPLHRACQRMARNGLQPDFVVDVGASTGVWSHVVATTFPDARYVLVEPLLGRHDAASRRHYLASIGDASVVEAAVGGSSGTAILHVDQHLYGATLLAEMLPGGDDWERVTVSLITLDDLAADAGLRGRGVLKLDIQGAELDALEGGRRFIADAIDVVVIEITLDPRGEAIPSHRRIDAWLESAGFVYLDDVGEWRDPKTGMLLQKDVMYARHDSPLAMARIAL